MIFSKFYRVLNAATESLQNKLTLRYLSSIYETHVYKCLTPENVNPNLKNVQYAITGPIFQRAKQIEKKLIEGDPKPFKKVMRLNIGDAQSLGQSPITFLRQVLTLVIYPQLLENKKFPKDAKRRAKDILERCPGESVGSYSDACGMEIIRKQIAEFIGKRDRCPADWKDCIMGHGATDVVKKFLFTLCATVNGKMAGVLNPVPEYPSYSAALAEFGLQRINYHLEEDNNWNVNINHLQKVVDQSRTMCNPRAIIIINPGNPTGHVLTRKAIEEIVRFAHEENLIIIADEVYQLSVLKNDKKFVSFKKVIKEMGEPYDKTELLSLMSVSKGPFFECGIKCGFGEFANFDPEIIPMFVKSISAAICPSVAAQGAVYAFTKPPYPNEPSYEQYLHETLSVIGTLKISATVLEESFNSMEEISCNPIEGAFFCYPQLNLPRKAIDEANKIGCSPDEFYAMELLNQTGICVVPGTGFGQLPGKYHIRMTILPHPDQLHKLMGQYKKFHYNFMKKYRDFNIF